MVDISQMKPNVCIRMERHRNAGLAGVKIEALRKLGKLGDGVQKLTPEYAFLFIKKVEDDSIFGIDLVTLKIRAFKKGGTGRMVEFDPKREKEFVDFWGWESVHFLNQEEVETLIETRAFNLDDAARSASKAAIHYRATTQVIAQEMKEEVVKKAA